MVFSKNRRRVLRRVFARYQKELIFKLLAVMTEVVTTAVDIILAALNTKVLGSLCK